MLAAVGGAQGAADLDGGVEQLGLVGAGIHLQHPLRRIGARRGGDLRETHADRQSGPMLAGIVAAVDLAVLVADKDHVGIVRVEQDRPDRQAMVRDVDLLPVLAAVGAAIRPGLRAGIDDLGLARMYRQGAHRRRLRQAVLQRLPFVAAVGHAAEARMHHPARPGFTGQAQIDVRFRGCSLAIGSPSDRGLAIPCRAEDRRLQRRCDKRPETGLWLDGTRAKERCMRGILGIFLLLLLAWALGERRHRRASRAFRGAPLPPGWRCRLCSRCCCCGFRRPPTRCC